MPITFKNAMEQLRKKTRPDLTYEIDPVYDKVIVTVPGMRGFIVVSRREIDDNLHFNKVRRFLGMAPLPQYREPPDAA